MNEWISFEESAWELFLQKLEPGARVSALRFLTLLEGENEEAVEEAFSKLEALSAVLDVSELPRPEDTGEASKRLALEEKLATQGKLLTDLPDTDPLALYLQELAGIPVCGDETVLALELAEANRQGKDSKGLSALVELSLARVVELAGEYTGRGVLLLDLIQEGSMGLWQGIRDYVGQEDFSAFRDRWIRLYMAKAVTLQARENGVGGKLRKALEAYRVADKKLLTQLGRNPTPEEIAGEMGITCEDVQVYEDMFRMAQLLQKAHAPEKEEPQEQEQAVEDTAYFQSRQRVAELLSQLTAQEAQVLSLRFGLEGGAPCTPQQVGLKLGLTADEVVAMEASALSKLRG